MQLTKTGWTDFGRYFGTLYESTNMWFGLWYMFSMLLGYLPSLTIIVHTTDGNWFWKSNYMTCYFLRGCSLRSYHNAPNAIGCLILVLNKCLIHEPLSGWLCEFREPQINQNHLLRFERTFVEKLRSLWSSVHTNPQMSQIHTHHEPANLYFTFYYGT